MTSPTPSSDPLVCFALLRTLMQGGHPLGGAGGGLLLPAAGLGATLGGAALLIAGAGVLGLRVRALRDAEAPESEPN